jgi:NitT/TauT family transport system permease protein
MTHASSRAALLFWQSLIVASVVLGWELSVRTGVVSPLLVAPPSSVAMELPSLFTATYRDLTITIFELSAGFGLSVVIGVAVGLVMGASAEIRAALFPYVANIHATPKIILFPLFLLAFGIGSRMNIMFGFFHGFFVIALNTVAGMRQVKPSLVYAALSMGASRRDIYRKVIIPSMVPALLSGFRLGLISTLVGVVVAEELIMTGGMGAVIILSAVRFEPAKMYGAIVLTALVAITINQLMITIQNRTESWRAR